MQWLSHVARVLSDATTRRRLLEASTAAGILAIVEEREHAIEEAEAAAHAPRKAVR